jgi:hypothetical protein
MHLVRWQRRKLQETLSVLDYGAAGDGFPRLVSEWIASGRFTDLAVIQAVYPAVVDLSDAEVMSIASSAALLPSRAGPLSSRTFAPRRTWSAFR